MNQGDIIISQKYDKLSKLSCRIFTNSLLRFIGEKIGIKNLYTYEIYTPTHKLKLLDIVIETAYGFCIDFEFHKSNTTEEIIVRNILYLVNFRLETKKLIKSYIISMGDEKSIRKAKIGPELEIELPIIFIKNFNGTEILKNIKCKIEKNIAITEDDLFNLIFLPFMKNEKSEYEITKELIYLINKIDLTEEQQYQIKACQILLIDMFIPEKEKEKMMKVVNRGSTFLENYEKNLIQKAEQKVKEESEKEFTKKLNEEKQNMTKKLNIEKQNMTKKLNEEKQNMAKKLKEDNVPPEKIIQYTGLSLNIIQKL